MYESKYVLSWIVYLDRLLKNNPGKLDIFLTGFMAALLLTVMLPAFYRLFARLKGRQADVRYRIHIWAGVAVFCILVGFFLLLLPPAQVNILILGSLLQTFGFIGFEFALFFPGRNSPLKGFISAFLLAGGLLAILLPLFSPLSAASALGFFSVLAAFLAVFFALASQEREDRKHLITGIELLLLGTSFFISFPRLQILIWVAVIDFFFLSDLLTLLQRKLVLLDNPGMGGGGPNRSGGEKAEESFVDQESFQEKESGNKAADIPEEEPEETMLPEKIDPVAHAINPFIPREFLNILNKDTVMDLQLGDHIQQEMTIFFSDIRQFTDLSENLTPEESFKFINSYLSRIVPEITENGGFVDKYIGDAILALYPQASGADMAVRTAIAIQKKVLEYNIHRASCGYRPLSMGIGLHTGTLMLGVVGVEGRMQNTVISDAVNLASRLESITKVFNVSMAISEQTFKKLADPGAYMYRFIGKVRVKGKSEPVSVFEIFDGIKSEVMERKMKANTYFEQGMWNYYQKEFGEALINFRKVLNILPEDGASLFYMQNCRAKIKIDPL
jgi:two-component system sensor histidine kinase ChiS